MTYNRQTVLLAMSCLLMAALAGCGREEGTTGQPAGAVAGSAVQARTMDSEPTAVVGAREPDMLVHAMRGNALQIATDGMRLTAPVGSVRHSGAYSVTALTEEELPSLPQGMENMTAAAAGYRLLPSGEHFSPAAELRVSYDPERLPEGYTPDDIHTSFFDSATLAWVRLERIEVDTVNHEIVSLTTHFTDFVNELLKAPEMPETQAFVPTMLTDLAAADPLEGLPLFQPPAANQEGTASLSYPLWIPQGRQGMQPSLVLAYSSGGGNGWLGVGWDLSVPSVTLDTRWGVPRYSDDKETEIYLLGGEQLVNKEANGAVIPLPHRTNQQQSRMTGDVRFYARTGDAHDSIVRHGDTPSDYWWEVTDRNGVTHYYGHYPTAGQNATNPSTLTDDRGNIARWMLCESRDPDSNWVRYFYEVETTEGANPGRQIYLDSIAYTGNRNEDGVYSVAFTRKERDTSDVPVHCNLGFKEETARQLCMVTVRSGDTILTAYRFETECGYRSNYKTRLTAVDKMDDIAPGTVLSCGVNPRDKAGAVARQEFGYHDAPDMKSLFDEERTVSIVSDSLEGFMLTPRHRIDSVVRATALGLSHSTGWSASGTVAVGWGNNVSNTGNSIGGNYHRGKNASETLLTLVDLDGDGLADKVFVLGGKMYWRKQTLLPNGDIAFGDTSCIRGVSHFLVEGSTDNTIGVQADVSIPSPGNETSVSASGSGAWSESVSTTPTYFADVDGDGLTDIVDNGSVLFNRLVDGRPTFERYQPQPDPGDGQPVNEPPLVTSSPCGGIIFDGEVDDSVGCLIVWVLAYSSLVNPEEEIQVGREIFYNGTICTMTETREYNGSYWRFSYRGRIDCSGRNLAMDGVPATEAVRVWVAPDNGTATVRSWVRLVEDESDSRTMSRHADGITYTIQHSRDITPMGDTLHSTRDTLLMSRHICADCYRNDDFDNSHYDSVYTFAVKEGDILFFRLRSNDDKQFDNVEDHVKITLNGTDYLSEEGFLLTESRYFQAPFDGEYIIDGAYSNTDATVIIDIKQPANPVHYGAGALEWRGDIDKDSVIRITLATTNPAASWSDVDLQARIRFWNADLPDTITVWTPGDRLVVHPSGNVWGNARYQRLFGKLYNGWGQFAYHPVGDATASPLIRPGSLVPTVHNLSGQASDTNGLGGRINRPVPDDGFGQPTLGGFIQTYGSQYGTISDSSCWVQTTADAIHSRWVAFGAQSSIGKDTVSNSLQESWHSSVAQVSEDSAVFLVMDAVYDDAIPESADGTPVKTVRKVSRSSTVSFTLGAGGVSEADSYGNSSVEMDYMDLNGDRYPDIVGPSIVQYRSQWGGLGEATPLPLMTGATPAATNSTGHSFSATPASHIRLLSGNPSKGMFTLDGDGNPNGGYSIGWNHTEGMWVDLNGDGLPDYVTQDGRVRLNTGYDFLDTVDWNFEELYSGQSVSATFGINSPSLSRKFNVTQASIVLGAGLSRSANRVGRTLTDINGDGLPDIVWRNVIDIDIDDWDDILHPLDSVHVRLNLGGGRWSRVYDVNIHNIGWSENHNESLEAGATLGVPFGVYKATFGLRGTPFSSAVNRDRMQLADIDGDGLPDLVTSRGEGVMTVRRNRGGKTNLLKSVTNFTGSRIWLDYALSDPGYEQPSRTWLLTQVATKDPLNPNGGDTTVTRFEYSRPRYDRLERTSYGYGTVVTHQIDPSDNTVYRTVRRDYHNENILVKGRPMRELTSDGEGNKYIEREYQYDFAAYDEGEVDTCSGNAYSLRDRVVTRYYEGADNSLLTTAEAYEYDRYHNVTRYIDEGDTAYGDDGLYVEMTYLSGQPYNLVGLREGYKAYATGTSGSDWLRRASFEYWPKGRLKKQTLHNSAGASDYEFWHDKYGNLVRTLKPRNDSLQRMEHLYTYDAYTHTYPVKTKNSHQDSVTTAYLLPFGKPTLVTDPGGNTMRYTYDRAGRLLTATSPLNGSSVPSLENEIHPVNYYNTDVPPAPGDPVRPYAVSTHYDDVGNPVTTTVVITDGFGRVVQTKKGITSGNLPMMQVSGREFTDPFGRVAGRHDAFCEDIGSSNVHFNPLVTMLVDTLDHDILDRVTEVSQPSMGYTATRQYGVHNDHSGRRRFAVAVTDPNGHTTEQYTDYDGRRVQVTDALGGTTRLTYDALGQLIVSTDPEDFVTTYTYDRLGRLTERVHPDAGTTQYRYDAAGNLTRETTPLGNIFYDYTYQRLAKKRYSNTMENNVTYTYGADGPDRGRLVRIEDGTGVRELSYDALGNVRSEIRTVALPGTAEVYTFATRYRHDSWGRMVSMTYPDGEVVTYTYTFGGQLLSMYGDKGTAHHDYVTSITYNDFDQRSRVDYGNGTYAEYTYDALHRLSQLSSVSLAGDMQQIEYSMDGVGNITRVDNGATPLGALGGAYTNIHRYDDLDRLVGSRETNMLYSVGMEYSPSGRLVHKMTDANATHPVDVDAVYGYCNELRPHAPRRIYEYNDRTLTELLWDDAGNLGQVNNAKNQVYEDSRFLFWTEDSRLHTVEDNKWHSYYAYDHAGERTLKLTGSTTVVDVNAGLIFTTSILTDATLYPSPYVVVTKKGYTKHYYVGGDRLCARIGGGGVATVSQDNTLSNKAQSLFQNCLGQSIGRVLSDVELECIHGLGVDEAPLRKVIEGAPSGLKANPTIELSDFVSTMNHYANSDDPENDVFYYHGDHLGGANWITDASGLPVQHLQYLPFGERYIDQRAAGTSYNERFTFTGKEKDEETGYGYFGARYMDHDLMTLWLSVDPMADKYPSISPYAYCAWNPVKLVDPDGRDGVKIIDKENHIITVKATYYVTSKSSQDIKETFYSEDEIASMKKDINNLLNNPKYTYEIDGEKYNVEFVLEFIPAGYEYEAMDAAKNDIYGNSLTIHPDNRQFIKEEKGTITHIGGLTCDDKDICMNAKYDNNRRRIHEIFHTLHFDNDNADNGIGNYYPGVDMPNQDDINKLLSNKQLTEIIK